jgi:hypothetical protein
VLKSNETITKVTNRYELRIEAGFLYQYEPQMPIKSLSERPGSSVTDSVVKVYSFRVLFRDHYPRGWRVTLTPEDVYILLNLV